VTDKSVSPIKRPKKRGRKPTRVIAGQQIGNWIILARLPIDRKTKSPNLRKRVKAQCICGATESLPLYYLTRKNPKASCGCLNKGLPANNRLEYRVWYMMNTRCLNPRHKSYKDYGGRGIKVCDRWARSNPHGFANFLKDMGPRRYITLTLDREDANGNYEPGNCRWATWDEQANNKRNKAAMPPPEQDKEALEDVGLNAFEAEVESPISCEAVADAGESESEGDEDFEDGDDDE
jgi:hypothetical protein